LSITETFCDFCFYILGHYSQHVCTAFVKSIKLTDSDHLAKTRDHTRLRSSIQ